MTSSLSPSVAAAIDDLELAARLVVEGMRTGGHRSPFHGFSTEFRQHRPYRLGDDLKHLDWKLYARSDRLYTRQFHETTNLSVLLVLDRSASMAYPETGVSKFRYAQIVCAALAYLVSDQGHAVGLMTTDRGKLTYVPARGGRVHLRSLIARLDRLDERKEQQACRRHQSQCRKEPNGAANVEVLERDPTRLLVLLDEERRDEKAAQHEEYDDGLKSHAGDEEPSTDEDIPFAFTQGWPAEEQRVSQMDDQH